MNFLSFALRNLSRNRRRSLSTILSIALGFAAVGLFAGYTRMVYQGLQDQAIFGEMLGHLTIEKPNFAKEGKLAPDRALFKAEEVTDLKTHIRKLWPQAQVAPRLGINGMLSNGRVSTIFIAEGLEPADMLILRGPRSYASGMLSNENAQGITLARGLADILSLKEGSEASILVSTIHGQANASDAQVIDVFSTANAGTEDKFAYLPLALARTLYDAPDRADRLTLLLTPGTDLEQARNELQAALGKVGYAVTIHTWQELSAFYRQVKAMFDMVFGFLLSIVVTIVVMSITNAMSMSVVERTREIGTLRAIGLRRGGIVRLFVTEAALLVVLGCAAGVLLMVAVRWGVNASDISYQPPNGTGRVPLLIGLDLFKCSVAGALLAVLTVVAAYLPAARAAHNPIIDSLAHS